MVTQQNGLRSYPTSEYPLTTDLLARVVPYRHGGIPGILEWADDGVRVDWVRLISSDMAERKAAVAIIAHGLSILERHGPGLMAIGLEDVFVRMLQQNLAAAPVGAPALRIVPSGSDCG